MGMFDDVPMAAPAARGGGMFDDIPVSKAPQNGFFDNPLLKAFVEDRPLTFDENKRLRDEAKGSAGLRAGLQAYDIGRSIDAGVDRGITGLLGAPADLARGVAWAKDWLDSRIEGRPQAELSAERDAKALVRPDQLEPFTSEAIRRHLQPLGGPGYEPQTVPGEYARTIGEFTTQTALMPGASARNLIGYGVVPGVASETAGQATKGKDYEKWARLGAGLGASGLAMLANRGGTVASQVGNASGDLSQAERSAALDRFDGLMADAKTNGIPLSPAFAWDAATNGVSDMAGLYRHAEAMGRMRGFNAQMPDAVDRAASTHFDTMAPPDAMPSMLGERTGETARAALKASPAGRDLEEAVRAVGPRVTADQAGQAVQRDLRGVQDRLETTRADQARSDYAAARAAPERVGIDRTITVERPGEPIVTEQRYSRPQFTGDAPQPLQAPGAAAGERPQSIVDYLSRNGGVPLDAETRAADLNRLYLPGGGTLARNGAPSWDDIRVRLTEAGFLPTDAAGAASAASVRDRVLDAIHQERIGRGRTVRMGEEGGDAARRGQVADEYEAGLSQAGGQLDSALGRAGVDPASVHPDIRSRTLNAMMGDARLDPLDAFERTVNAMRENPRPLSRSTTVTEKVSAPRFGQANPQAALDTIDDMLLTAKGDVRSSLVAARRDLFEARADPVSGVRETDLSIAGLHQARERLDRAIDAAVDMGDRVKASRLAPAREALDRALKQSPEMATADQRFAELSAPLERFGANEPLGRVTARDEMTRRMQVPTEQVPSHLSGATATREALAVGTPATREALQGRLVTQIMDGATDLRGGVSAERLRTAMREQEDVLAQFPEARERLNRVALAQDGRDALKGTLVGRLAERDRTTAQAVDILFPKGGELLANGEREIGAGVATLVRQNPAVARQLVRAKAENLFNAATKDAQAGANQMGGAKYAAQLVGNPQEAANLTAAVRALPEGDTIAEGFGRFLDVLKATGLRQNVGSRTAYNDEFLAAAREGGTAEGVARLAAGGFVKFPAKVQERLERWRLGRNVDELARLLSDPDAIGAFRGLVAAGNRGGDIRGPVARLVAIAARGAQQPPVLQITVRPGENRQ